MASASSVFIIGLGTPTVVAPSLTIMSIGSEGELGALRTLTHPDSDHFAPFAYYRNPDFTSNLYNQVLTAPDARLQKTASSSVLIRQEGVLRDVTCEETWGAQQGRQASMPTFLFLQLYEYLVNPPEFDALAQTYIQWRPRDRSLLAYNVHLFKLIVGRGSKERVFTVKDIRGAATGIASPLDTMDVSPTGLMDQAVTASLHIVSEVVV